MPKLPGFPTWRLALLLGAVLTLVHAQSCYDVSCPAHPSANLDSSSVVMGYSHYTAPRPKVSVRSCVYSKGDGSASWTCSYESATGNLHAQASSTTSGSCPVASVPNCASCPAGTSLGSDGKCQTCPLNQVNAVGNTEPTCKSCPETFILKADRSGCTCAEGSGGENGFCQPCGGGWYSTGGANCKWCPAGWFSISTTQCSMCKAGTYSTKLGAWSSEFCQNCPPGTNSLSGASGCTQCRTGTYNPIEGQQYCTGCPIGTYSTAVGAKDDSICTICPEGSSTPGAGSASCTPCRAGTYSSPDRKSCISCPIGSASAAVGSSDPMTCKACSGTLEFGRGGATACLTCSGANQIATANHANCQCIEGYGRTSSSTAYPTLACSATRCPAGQFANNNSACTACPAGSVSTPNRDRCEQCAAGTFKTGNACMPCDNDKISTPGAAGCTTCEFPLTPNSSQTECVLGASQKARLKQRSFSRIRKDTRN